MSSQTPIITITTATKLTPEQQQAAKKLVASRAGTTDLVFAIDPKVLGGIKVEIGAQLFDATLEGQLKQLALPGNSCVVTTAVPLSPNQKEKLFTAITTKYGSVAITEKVSPEVIGGIKVVIGSKEFDQTIAGKLHQLHAQTLIQM